MRRGFTQSVLVIGLLLAGGQVFAADNWVAAWGTAQ